MARVPKMAGRKFPSAHGIHWITNIFLTTFARPASLYCEEYVYVYIHAYLIAYRLFMLYCYYQIILPVKHFYTNRKRCAALTGYLSLGHPLGGDWTDT
jgi:hypothetical protein